MTERQFKRVEILVALGLLGVGITTLIDGSTGIVNAAGAGFASVGALAAYLRYKAMRNGIN
jgi:hypothetical protein